MRTAFALWFSESKCRKEETARRGESSAYVAIMIPLAARRVNENRPSPVLLFGRRKRATIRD